MNIVKKIYFLFLFIGLIFSSIIFVHASSYSLPNNFATMPKEEQVDELKKLIRKIQDKIIILVEEKKNQDSQKDPYQEKNLEKNSCNWIKKEETYYYYPPKDIKYSEIDAYKVTHIEKAFNFARFKEPGLEGIKMNLPDQKKWDSFTVSEKALYLINSERQSRGLMPFEAISPEVTEVAWKYADDLRRGGYFEHIRKSDGADPWDRLDENKKIKNNQDWYSYAENLYAFDYSGSDPEIVFAIYNWIYDDSKSDWGHRDFILSKNLLDNGGLKGSEGLLGIGFVTGKNSFFSSQDSTVIVMNLFDPGENWFYGDEIYVNTAEGNRCETR